MGGNNGKKKISFLSPWEPRLSWNRIDRYNFVIFSLKQRIYSTDPSKSYLINSWFCTSIFNKSKSIKYINIFERLIFFVLLNKNRISHESINILIAWSLPGFGTLGTKFPIRKLLKSTLERSKFVEILDTICSSGVEPRALGPKNQRCSSDYSKQTWKYIS